MDEQIEVGRAKHPCVASNEFHSKIRRMQLFRKAIDEIVEVLVKAANAGKLFTEVEKIPSLVPNEESDNELNAL